MATKKPSPKAKAKPVQLQDLAAHPASFTAGDALLEDEQLVDTSGVFRVTSAIAQAQIGHDEDRSAASGSFASDSLVMAAQRDGFRERGPTLGDTAEEQAPEDEAAAADRRSRIATLAARNAARPKPPR
jgi:hypothetical protein